MIKKDFIEKIKALADGVTDPDKVKEAIAAADAQSSWLGQVAVLTGILAAVAGFLTVRMGTLTNDAIYESNQAVLAQTEASDAWSEYQADSIKARVVEMQLLPSVNISAADRQNLTTQQDDLRTRQPKSKQTAQDKEKERDMHLAQSQSRVGEKGLLGYASMAAQLGIAVASVAALTRKRPVFYLAAAIGIASIGIVVYALINTYLLTP